MKKEKRLQVLLAAASSIYLKDHRRGAKNNSGFAHMMGDIAQMLAQEGAAVQVISQSIFTPQRRINGWTLCRKRWLDLCCSWQTYYFRKAMTVIKASNAPLSFRLRILLYFLTGSYVEKIIRQNHPEIVHIHGIGEGSLPYLYACARTGTPCAVTLHGLVSFSETTRATPLARRMERAFLQLAAQKGFRFSVVSSGIKRRVNDWLGQEGEQITVIGNPVKQRQSIPVKGKQGHLLCVGNITQQKNQIMVLRAFRLLQKKEGLKVTLTLVGGGNCRAELEEYVRRYSLTGVTFTGLIERSRVDDYYAQADLLVTAGIDEGFGLPIIEAYSHGVPVVALADMDAIADVYHRQCMVLVQQRTDEALAQGIKQALAKEWNQAEIKQYADQFSFGQIGHQYFQWLSSCKTNRLTVAEVEWLLGQTIKDDD